MRDRLRESGLQSSDPIDVEAATLLRSLEPLEHSAERDEKIRQVLLEPERRMSAMWLRPAIAVGVVLLVCAAAAALVAPWRRTAPVPPPDAPRTAPRNVAPVLPRLPESAPPPASSAAAADSPTPAAPVSAPAKVATRPRRTAAVEAPRPTSVPPPATERAAMPSEQESRLLAEAARLLRRDGQPARAAEILDGYFARFPAGALQEEALALAMEAARAQQSPRAGELARRYLARFPTGRFVDLARRIAGP